VFSPPFVDPRKHTSMLVKTRAIRSKSNWPRTICSNYRFPKGEDLKLKSEKKIMHARVDAPSLSSQHIIHAKPNPNRSAQICFLPISKIVKPEKDSNQLKFNIEDVDANN
jgi:hypothetical protein